MKRTIQNIILFISSLILIVIIVETISFLLLKYSKQFHHEFPYFNRQLSPYYVFENTPGYKYTDCIKTSSSDKDIEINKDGFISEKTINKTKPPNTIRIVLTGGSALFGSGQHKAYSNIKRYPEGIYSFGSSISGQLQSMLDKAFPKYNIEVLNFAATQRMIHQSLAYYLETISDYNPDILISMDGMNDISTLMGISPYYKARLLLPSFVTLYNISEKNAQNSFPYFFSLLNSSQIVNIKKDQDTKSRKYFKYFYNYSYNSSANKDYQAREQEFIKGSEKFQKLIQYFHSVCSKDDVEFIFCLQPILYRNKFNKKLSPTENKMRQTIRPNNLRLSFPDLKTSLIDSLENSSNLVLKYFFDNYLSDKILQISKSDKFLFLDLNKEIRYLTSDIEFYVDYCHLTPFGNIIIADILKNKISEIIVKRINSQQ